MDNSKLTVRLRVSVLTVGILFFVISCDMFGGNEPPKDKKDKDERVAVTLKPVAAAGDTSVAADIYLADTLAFPDTSRVSLKMQKTGNRQSGSAEAPYFRKEGFKFTPNRDHTKEIRLNRKKVMLEAAVIDSATGSRIDTATVSVLSPSGDTVRQTTGTLSDSLPARSGKRTVVATQPSWSKGAKQISGHTDNDITIAISDIPNCRDDIDNDGDGLVDQYRDANNTGAVDEGDAGDPGCPTADDNDEPHRVFTRVSLSSSTKDSSYVSSAKDHRTAFHVDDRSTNYPPEIKHAVAGILVVFEFKVDSTQSNEEAAVRFACGPSDSQQDNVNFTNITKDKNQSSGWVNAQLNGVDKSFFATGTNCATSLWHGTKVRGQPPGDGNDDVIHYLPDGKNRIDLIGFAYEAEYAKKSSQQNQKALQPLNRWRCFQTVTSRACVKKSTTGYPRWE